jgi:hypothetical protein
MDQVDSHRACDKQAGYAPQGIDAACGNNSFAGAVFSGIFARDIPTDVSITLVAEFLALYAGNGDGLRADLRALLADNARLGQCASKSYLHGNGFYKIVLSETALYKLRLHVWLPGATAEENLHEHRWHFASTVLTGALYSEIHAEDVTANAQEYEEYLYLAKDGVSPPSQTYIGKTRLACLRTSVRRAGQHYAMKPNTLHRIVRTDGGLTATLMCQSSPARRSNRLLTRPGQVPDVAQRYMSPADLATVVTRLLADLGIGRQ